MLPPCQHGETGFTTKLSGSSGSAGGFPMSREALPADASVGVPHLAVRIASQTSLKGLCASKRNQCDGPVCCFPTEVPSVPNVSQHNLIWLTQFFQRTSETHDALSVGDSCLGSGRANAPRQGTRVGNSLVMGETRSATRTTGISLIGSNLGKQRCPGSVSRTYFWLKLSANTSGRATVNSGSRN